MAAKKTAKKKAAPKRKAAKKTAKRTAKKPGGPPRPKLTAAQEKEAQHLASVTSIGIQNARLVIAADEVKIKTTKKKAAKKTAKKKAAPKRKAAKKTAKKRPPFVNLDTFNKKIGAEAPPFVPLP